MHRAVGFAALLRAFRLALTAEGLSPRTVGTYSRDVRRFSSWVENRSPRSISTAHIRDYFAQFQNGRSPKTVREAQLALRRFFRFLVGEGEIRRDPPRDMKLACFRAQPQPTYTEAEVKRLLLACDLHTLEGLRNRAPLVVLFDTGVREGELVSMGLPDWERRRVRVSGKTGVRDVPLGMAALQALERYARRWDISEPPLWRGKRGAHGLRCPPGRPPPVPTDWGASQGRPRLPPSRCCSDEALGDERQRHPGGVGLAGHHHAPALHR
jgi:site-specific recombinase XerD